MCSGVTRGLIYFILLRTHGPYHRHKSTKSVLLYISTHYRKAVSSFVKAQKMGNHTVGHYTTGVSTCPALRRARPIPALLTFLCLVCTQCPHILLRKSNTGETQTPKHFRNIIWFTTAALRLMRKQSETLFAPVLVWCYAELFNRFCSR